MNYSIAGAFPNAHYPSKVFEDTLEFASVDVNECLINNGGCSQLCVNLQGSHRCDCNVGYMIVSNGRSCNGECITLI